MKSIKKSYLIVLVGIFLPSWIALFFLSNDEGYSFTIAFILYAIAFWGTSFGYFYLNKWKYGILSGLGKWLIIAIGIGIHFVIENNGHPYIIAIGLILASLWGIIDFIILSVVAKKVNNSYKLPSNS